MKEMFEDTRNVFARAFYLSEPQILDLYVHTGNPKALLPHLRLCFPGVHNVLWETEVSTHKLTTVEDVNSECVYPYSCMPLPCISNLLRSLVRFVHINWFGQK